ncbi:M23 family metallopeptidase, partial [Sulfurimonas sp. SAG-AH-194-C20]
MILKFLLLFLALCCSLSASDNYYPKSYEKLASPLFSAAQHFSKYEHISSLKVLIQEYESEVNEIMLSGYHADISENFDDKKIYLQELRKLQFSYEKLLHSLHNSIAKSIQDNDYKLFLELTSYSFDGLFASTNLRKQAISFYLKHKNENNLKCAILEKNMKNEKLCSKTQELFSAEVTHSTYNSNLKNKAKKSVSISTKRVKNTIEVFLSNKNIYDITIAVKYKTKNMTMSAVPPKEFVLKAKSKYHYTTFILGEGESSYGFSWSYIMGSRDAIHDDNYVYRLPFKVGTKHRISQGYNAKETHKGNSSYSLDFSMPEETKVYASRKGIVVKIKSNSNRGGYDKKYASSGNYVKIMHSDGTFAVYYHLKYNGVLVKTGTLVSKGEPLGYSGNTGYSSGPHLH